MLMGYGQPKHAMISGDKQQNPLIFATLHSYLPYDSRAPEAARLNARSAAMNAAKEQEIKMLALEAKGEAPVVIDVPEIEGEALESVVPPPEPPETFGGGGSRR
jgi:hypothetical protein